MEKRVLNNHIDLEIGKRLRHLRENVGLTQDQLSERLKISNNYYGQVERSYKELSKQLAAKLAEFYSVTLDYLYYGSDKELIYENPEYSNKGELIRYIRSCSEEDCTILLPIVRTVNKTFWQYREYQGQEDEGQGQEADQLETDEAGKE